MLAQPGSLARSLHEEVFRSNGVEVPSAQILTMSLHLHLRMIESGRWLGLVPASVVRFGGKRMRLHIKALPIQMSSPPSPIGFVRLRDRTLTPLAERFIECSRKVARSNSGHASMPRA